MIVFRAIGRFFARIWRWIKETAWVQPLLIVGGIFAIIFSIPYLTKWVKSWFVQGSASEKYYAKKQLKLKGADKDHSSEADDFFEFIQSYHDGEDVTAGKKKYGEKFFLTLVQENCAACEERYEAFETLEKEWNKGSYTGLDGKFKMHTIYVDTKNSDGDNLFEKVYERPEVMRLFENTVSYMQGDYDTHPYRENTDGESYDTNLKNLMEREEISTPVTFLFDFTDDNPAEWTSDYGVREVLFSFSGTNGSDKYAKARTLRDCWTNVWGNDSKAGADNKFSPYYKG